MNLVTGEWIPVVDGDKSLRRIGLKRLFEEAHTIRDLAVTPPQRIALMRMLTCIVQTAMDGPENEAEWKSCKSRIAPESIAYLEDKIDCFNLYGPNPFMQVPTLEHKFNAVVDKLDFGLSAGNNSVLFDHEASNGGRAQEDGWMALMLITYLAFSPGGLIGTTKWGKDETGKTSEHALCVECSALHTYIRRDNLLETIHANTLAKDQVAAIANLSWGRPTWEIDRRSRRSEELQASVTTYLGRMVPLTRAILLEQGNSAFTLANGLEYPKFPECREITTTVVERKNNKLTYVPTALERHPWRALNALLTLGSQHGAFALQNLQRGEGVVDIWTGGLAADKGKILDTAEWSITVPLSMVGSDGPLLEYRKGVEHAELAEKRLYGAVKCFADKLKLDPAPMPKARTFFWSFLDQHYQVLMDTVGDSNMSFDEKWTPLLRRAMMLAFEYACPCETPRQIQAYAQAKKVLTLKDMDTHA